MIVVLQIENDPRANEAARRLVREMDATLPQLISMEPRTVEIVRSCSTVRPIQRAYARGARLSG